MFVQSLTNYSRNLDALRDFVDVVEPVLQSASSKDAKEHARYLAPLFLSLREAYPDQFKLDDEVAATLENWPDAIELEWEENQEEGRPSYKLTFPRSEAGGFVSALKRMDMRTKQSQLLYDATLQSLVSATESFVSTVLHEYYARHPSAVDGSKDKVFSYSDLASMESIEDARKHFVESRVEGILRESFETWLEVLNGRFDLKMGYMNESRDKISEVFQRRNLVVHNGGAVNTIYMSNVPKELRSGLSLGEGVGTTRGYLDRSISLFERSFLLIGAELWKKLAPEDEARGGILIDIAYEHLQAERWQIAESLSYFVSNDKRLKMKTQLMGRVNYWQAIKWQGRFDEVAEQIKAEDFSASDEVFQLARLVLLGSLDQCFEMIPTLVETKALPPKTLNEWPLFRELRKDTRFDALISELEIDDEDEQTSIRDDDAV